MLAEDEEVQEKIEQIFITPPEVNADSDEDSTDEDNGGYTILQVCCAVIYFYLDQKNIFYIGPPVTS